MDLAKIAVVGLGGAGCGVIGSLCAGAGERPALAAIDTDARRLEALPSAVRIQIGMQHARGLGTGGDVECGRLSARDDRDRIREFFEGKELVFVLLGLGGGAGMGAAPEVLHAAREAGALTLCFATTPFGFEGANRKESADLAVPGLKESADGLVLISNDRLLGSTGETQVEQAFQGADELLGKGVRAFWTLLTRPGYIRLGLADLQKQILGCGGICAFGFGEGQGETRCQAAVSDLVKGDLAGCGDALTKAGALLVSICGGPDLTLREVGEVMNAVQAKVPAECCITMGTVVDEAWAGRLEIALLAAEQWVGSSGTERPGVARRTRAPRAGGRSAAGGTTRARQLQQDFSFVMPGRGKFKDVEPTVMDGEDLDVPTFMRRGLTIEK